MNNRLIKSVVVFSLLLIHIPALAQNPLPTVVSVGDGDTLRIRNQGKTITVRLGCIDAPEKKQQSWGEQSAARLRQILPPGTAVRVRQIDLDRYGRTVAELYKGNSSVNLQLVQEGKAVVYHQYLSGCASTKSQYLQAEAEAKHKQLGYWNQPSPVMPWDFRRAKYGGSQPTTASTPNATPEASQLPACVNSDCNCSDFETQAQAVRVLAAFPDDPFGLDRDRDGLPCESLP